MDLTAALHEAFAPVAESVAGITAGALVRGERAIVTFGGGREDGIYQIGSVTKTFTALLLAAEVADGAVAYDDPVAKYLPEDSRPTVVGREITLLDLAIHVSGLPRLPPGTLELAEKTPHDPYSLIDVDGFHDALRATTPERAPGEKAEYSNYGFMLLGHILGRARGTTYEASLQERVIAPLGLRETTTARPDDPRRIVGHNAAGDVVHDWTKRPSMGGAGCVWSTCSDVLDYLALHLDPAGSPLQAAIEDVQTSRRDGVLGEQGLGWVIVTKEQERAHFHNGGTGGFSSAAIFRRADDVAIVALLNTEPHPALDQAALRLAASLA